ncbi:unnamed protein product [Blepharisma stoltei]|uniref:Uncharacterized protein n=1 Tax=Blepharisma stoltei TaxID=1481888 RepID=A0AAU9KCB3_9CILI|nr:unnamed protein product [Blepharisma stoltei]
MKTYLSPSQASYKKTCKLRQYSKLKGQFIRCQRFPPKAPHNTTQYLIAKPSCASWDPEEILGTMIDSNKLLINNVLA